MQKKTFNKKSCKRNHYVNEHGRGFDLGHVSELSSEGGNNDVGIY